MHRVTYLNQIEIITDAIAKIAFHTGIVSYQLFNLLAKTLCQLIVIKEDSGALTWILLFDQEPLKGNIKAVSADCIVKDGMSFQMTARIGEEFFVTVPISGEKAKVSHLPLINDFLYIIRCSLS